MEALLEKEGDVENWNDDRLDELSQRMDAGFEKAATKEEMNLRFDKVDHNLDKADREFDRLNDRLDKLFYGLSFFGLTLVLNLAADKL